MMQSRCSLVAPPNVEVKAWTNKITNVPGTTINGARAVDFPGFQGVGIQMQAKDTSTTSGNAHNCLQMLLYRHVSLSIYVLGAHQRTSWGNAESRCIALARCEGSLWLSCLYQRSRNLKQVLAVSSSFDADTCPRCGYFCDWQALLVVLGRRLGQHQVIWFASVRNQGSSD